MTPIDRRSEILEQIRQCVCVDRCKTHGEAEVNLAHLADVWRWWIKARYGIDVPLDSLDSSQMMSLSKVSRKACNPYVVDHWADDAGYDVIGAGIVKKYLDEQAMKKELDGLASAKPARCRTWRENPHRKCVLNEGHAGVCEFVAAPIDHGEEELRKGLQPTKVSACNHCGGLNVCS